jgi:hypothetical protein
MMAVRPKRRFFPFFEFLIIPLLAKLKCNALVYAYWSQLCLSLLV